MTVKDNAVMECVGTHDVYRFQWFDPNEFAIHELITADRAEVDTKYHELWYSGITTVRLDTFPVQEWQEVSK